MRLSELGAGYGRLVLNAFIMTICLVLYSGAGGNGGIILSIAAMLFVVAVSCWTGKVFRQRHIGNGFAPSSAFYVMMYFKDTLGISLLSIIMGAVFAISTFVMLAMSYNNRPRPKTTEQ